MNLVTVGILLYIAHEFYIIFRNICFIFMVIGVFLTAFVNSDVLWAISIRYPKLSGIFRILALIGVMLFIVEVLIGLVGVLRG